MVKEELRRTAKNSKPADFLKYLPPLAKPNFKKDSSGKRVKLAGSRNENGNSKAEVETSSGAGDKPEEKSNQPAEPPKQDYIHVRARRGQATDSHSLAEIASREKISERMKILQDLVPGCNKSRALLLRVQGPGLRPRLRHGCTLLLDALSYSSWITLVKCL